MHVTSPELGPRHDSAALVASELMERVTPYLLAVSGDATACPFIYGKYGCCMYPSVSIIFSDEIARRFCICSLGAPLDCFQGRRAHWWRCCGGEAAHQAAPVRGELVRLRQEHVSVGAVGDGQENFALSHMLVVVGRVLAGELSHRAPGR